MFKLRPRVTGSYLVGYLMYQVDLAPLKTALSTILELRIVLYLGSTAWELFCTRSEKLWIFSVYSSFLSFEP